jgi:hypothetical protein
MPQDLVLTPPEPMQHTPMDLLGLALRNNAAIDVIERLAALQDKQMAREAEQAFSQSLASVQEEISYVVGDLTNAETTKKYASFRALNKAIRPVYLKHGFNLSFGCAEASRPDEVLVLCDCSHRGFHTRRYMIPMPCDGKGAKGGGVMSKTHAMIAATTSGRNTLLRLIFNLAVTEAEEATSSGEFVADLEKIGQSASLEELKDTYAGLYDKYEATSELLKAVIAARKARIQRGF